MDEQMAKIVAAELKRFVTSLELSDEQVAKAKSALEKAAGKMAEYQKSEKVPTKEELAAWQSSLRKALEGFLTPEQLGKWDEEVRKAKSFLGQKLQVGE